MGLFAAKTVGSNREIGLLHSKRTTRSIFKGNDWTRRPQEHDFQANQVNREDDGFK